MQQRLQCDLFYSRFLWWYSPCWWGPGQVAPAWWGTGAAPARGTEAAPARATIVEPGAVNI